MNKSESESTSFDMDDHFAGTETLDALNSTAVIKLDEVHRQVVLFLRAYVSILSIAMLVAFARLQNLNW